MRYGDVLEWLKVGAARKLVALVIVLQAAAIVLFLNSERSALRREQAAAKISDWELGLGWRENSAKPIITPPVLKAKDAVLKPDDYVIGVEVDGKTRAYALAAFDDPSGHIVNDLVGKVSVSVSYCNLTRCVRVYTDPQSSVPLDARSAGVFNGEMIVSLAGNLYSHRTGKPLEPDKNPMRSPYSLLSPTLTTWQRWVEQHPETEVYTSTRSGGRRRGPSPIAENREGKAERQQPGSISPKQEETGGSGLGRLSPSRSRPGP